MVGEEGEQLGVMTVPDALKKAEDAGLDLVEVAPTANPPVCRIIDYSKYKYEQEKREKEARKKQVHVKVKELKFHPNINENDFEVKKNHAVEFLKKGCKVKLSMFFRGREMAHFDIGMKVMERIVAELAPVGTPETPLRRMGPSIITFMAPGAKK